MLPWDLSSAWSIMPALTWDLASSRMSQERYSLNYYYFIFFQNWLKVVNVNTLGMLNVTSAIFPLLAGRKFGHVVNISSVCGQSVIENHVVYGAGKYFIEGFSQGLRREGLRDGIKEHNTCFIRVMTHILSVKVTVIRPSAVRTGLGRVLLGQKALLLLKWIQNPRLFRIR